MTGADSKPIRTDPPGTHPVTTLVHKSRARVLGRSDIVFFIFVAMVSAGGIPVYAAIGVSVVGWWILGTLLFLLPSSLIVVELSTAYPYQGGIYDWVHRAFGERWAARTTYWYWVNMALWMPAAYLVFTGSVIALGWSTATVFQQSMVCIALTWITVGLGFTKLKIGDLFTNISAILVAFILIVIIIGSFVLFFHRGASANHFSVHSMLPNFGSAKVYLPVIVFGFLGMELISSLAGEIKHPKKDMLWAIPVAGVTLTVLQLLATIALLLVIPLKVLGLTSGVVQVFKDIFGSVSFIIPWILSIPLLYTIYIGILPWALGANRSALEAAREGALPHIFMEESKSGTPAGGMVMTGIVATAVLLFAGVFLKTENSLYYALFASSSAVFILPYLLMYPAIFRLRRIEPVLDRPFRVPGGRIGLWVCVSLSTTAVLSSLVLFLWTPGSAVNWSYTGPLIAIFSSAVVSGEIVIAWCLRKGASPSASSLEAAAGLEAEVL
jgi:amino acid transporter